MIPLRFLCCLLALLALAPDARAQDDPARFASLRASEVNLRAGPGMRYPIEWQFQRRNLPVVVLRRLENWRRIRDADGTTGWVHQSMLSSRRTVMVMADGAEVRARASEESRLRARAEQGAIGMLRSCTEGVAWCEISFSGVDGWVRGAALWGAVAPREGG